MNRTKNPFPRVFIKDPWGKIIAKAFPSSCQHNSLKLNLKILLWEKQLSKNFSPVLRSSRYTEWESTDDYTSCELGAAVRKEPGTGWRDQNISLASHPCSARCARGYRRIWRDFCDMKEEKILLSVPIKEETLAGLTPELSISEY